MRKLANGFSIVEIIIAITLITTILIILFQSLANIFAQRPAINNRQKLIDLAQQGIEVSYHLSISKWDDIKNYNGNYYPVLQEITPNKSEYILVPGDETIDKNIVRKITFEKAKRDENGNLNDTGTEDPETIKVTSVVSDQKQEINFKIYLIDINSIETL